jgi:hypothetical protein
MNIRHALVAAVLPLMLAACDREAPPDPPKPQVTAPPSESGDKSLAASGANPVPGPKGEVHPVPPSSVAGQAPAPADAGKDSPATQPASTLSESEEENKMPLAGHGNNHSSDSLKSGKAN